MEDWFSQLPQDTRADVRGRIQSSDDRQFYAAYWEMYVHESLRREGFELTAHPELPDSSTRPDFLAERASTACYVEATVVGQPDEQTAADQRVNAVYDALDQLESPNFHLWIHVEEEGATSPPARQLRMEVSRWLGGLDVDDQVATLETSGYEALATMRCEVAGWVVSFRAMPKDAAHRGTAGARPLGVFERGGATMVDDIGSVRSDLEAKARRYGRPDRPFVIAVAVNSVFFDADNTLSGALFGRQAVQFDPQTLQAQETRHPDGFWWGPGGPRNTRVSAVVASPTPGPWQPTKAQPVTWHNPWAALPLEDILPWRAMLPDVAAGRMEKRDGRPAADVLGLPEGWPGPEDPFPDM